jgi:predicted DNA binding CopG/RHH family protein
MNSKKKAKRVIPAFKTEAEEVGWWYDNRKTLDKEFLDAHKRGETTRLTKEKLRERIEASKKKAATAINIRVADQDLQLARKLADKKGLPYQTYIKSLLHEALERESQS